MIYKKLKKANKIRSFLLTFCNNEILNVLKQKNPMLINTYSPINLFNTNSSNYEIKIENEIQKGNYNIFDYQKFENILSRSKTADENKIEEELNKVNDVINYISKIKDKKVFVSQKKLNKVFFHEINNSNNELKTEKKENLFKNQEKQEEKKIKFYALKLQKYADKFINYKEKKKKKKTIKNLDNIYDNKTMKNDINSSVNYSAKSENNLEIYKSDTDYDFKICLVSMKRKKNYKIKIGTEINFNNNNNNNHNNHNHIHHATSSKKKVQFDIDKSSIYYTKTDSNINRIRKIKSYTQLTKIINIKTESD